MRHGLFFSQWRWLAVLAMLASAAAAQDIPEGPGLGAEADTLTFEAGAAFARVRPPVIAPSVRVDVLSPVPGVLPQEAYLLDAQTGAFRLVAPFDTLTVLVVRYRRFPTVAPSPGLRVLAPEATERDSARARPPPLVGTASRVTTTGSITRGVVAGSNRDVSLTSGLRLDISGEVAPGVTVTGALTDTDTPIVPEGTTQTLSDFDRVFVAVDGPGLGARLGDVDLSLQGSAFASLERKVQGATLSLAVPEQGVVRGGSVEAGVSAVRGRFRSQGLLLRDGVQGPYRLEGDRGEPFVLVVPGSERVFWDGAALTRGRDYTVDYGTGEITFTAARLVTAERRATVDFEFSAGGYARTLTVASGTVGLFPGRDDRSSRGTLGVRFLREADSPGLGDALGLSETDLDLIAASGPRDAIVPGETLVPFEEESPFVLYSARDTTVAGETYRIFVPASAEADSVFRVRFSRVRAGEGTYRRAGQALNGILYEWVGPVGGDYVPFRILPRPASRSVLDVRGEVLVTPGVVAFAEGARSVDDVNTLSGLDPDGGAGAYETGLRFDGLALGPGVLTGGITRRQRASEFRTLDRVRRVDFNRRWNLARAGAPFEAALDTLGEASTEASARWALTERSALEVEGGTIGIGEYRARRAGVVAALSDLPSGALPAWTPALRYTFDAVASDSGATGLLGSGSFLRHALDAERPVLGGRVTPRLGVVFEDREQRGGALAQDTLLASTYQFLSLRPGLAYTTSALAASATVEVRREAEPLGPIGSSAPLADAARSLGAEADIRVRGASGFRIDARAAYRRTRFEEPFRQLGRQDAESLALQLTTRVQPLSRALDIRARYEALTERTPVLQEAYVLVGAEAGQFVWRDGEGEPRAGEPDGRQQVDEFFPETTPFEGTYLRTFVPSDELLPAVGVEGRLAVRLDGARVADGLGVAWGRLVDARASVEVRERSTSGDLLRVLLFDPGVLQQREGGQEMGTVDGRFRLDGEVSILPRESRRGLRVGFDHLTTTRQLAAGAEARLVQSVRADGRLGLAGGVLARLSLRLERRRSESAAFASRTYDLRGITAEPSVTFTPGASTSLTVGAVVSSREDARAGTGSPTGALLARIPGEARWSASSRVSVTARAELSIVSLRGGTGSGLALFELTDGRGPGTSALGSIQATVGLTEAIRATLVADVRAPASAPLVQTIRASVSAVF
ncbi:MAG: hypothetical protein AAGI52_01545 [Bacteroidota bacterium]